MPYRQMPERLYDDPDELALWAGRALEAAQRKSIAKQRAARTGRRLASRRRK
jgi:DNA transformation protein